MSVRARASVGMLALLLIAAPAWPANIIVNNGDGVDEGFNDTTPATPVGGNNGATVGQQRMNVFLRAAQIWGSILQSNVNIQVNAQWEAQFCDATSATLGSAGASSYHQNFPNAPIANTLYPQALANKIAGSDRSATADMTSTFNSDIGSNVNCLPGSAWYYGLDNNEDPEDIDLLEVVLHEMGHGLGFATPTNKSTGAFQSGIPDIYARHILDLSNGLHWHQMSQAQRQASAINTGNVVWDGSQVTARAPDYLERAAQLMVNSPGSIAGAYAATAASFGAAVSINSLAGDLVLVNDGGPPESDACSPILNTVTGKIALIDRGNCPFVDKALAAQNAGAIGVVIVNNVSGPPPTIGGSNPSITIPVIGIRQADGTLIKNELMSGDVNVTFTLHPTQLAGTASNGMVQLYAPNPVSTGSSISHWDVSARPNLLMEPAINDDLEADVDLTRSLFIDIGWFGTTVDVPVAVTPRQLALLGNAPNPFGRGVATAIRFEIDRQERAELDVFDLAGRHVTRLLAQDVTPGAHVVIWDGTDAQGRPATAGVYLYRLRAGGDVESSRMVLVR